MEYSYFGYTDSRQIVKGKISAVTEQAAADVLAKVGYNVVNLELVTPFLPDLGKLFQGKVKQTELVTFSRQLALLLESGVGIVQSLELLQNQTADKQLKRVLIEIVSDIRGGNTLAVALAKHPGVFSKIYHKMVGVGEQTGGLEDVLRNLADYAEREAVAIKKLKQALTYPAIVACLAIVVIIVMVTFVLPPIVGLFASLGGELPITTRALLAIVGLLNAYGLYFLVGIVGLVIAAFIYIKSPAGRYRLDMLLLKLPVLGRINHLAELGRCCRNLSLLFKAGLPLLEVMTLTAQASGNQVVSKALGDMEQEVLKGEGLAVPMKKNSVFLPLMAEMTRVGVETGKLDETLMVVALSYELEADSRMQTLLSMIEPAMTIAMGVVVGFIALSIFTPIYSSLSLVGG